MLLNRFAFWFCLFGAVIAFSAGAIGWAIIQVGLAMLQLPFMYPR